MQLDISVWQQCFTLGGMKLFLGIRECLKKVKKLKVWFFLLNLL